MNTVKNEYQDRRGFYHSCGRETYCLLRRVRHYAHWQRIQQARHDRWSAKLPHNRVKWVFDGFHDAPDIGYTKWKSVPWPEPILCPINLSILRRDYETAKDGKESFADVKPLFLSDSDIQAMIDNCEEWMHSIV